MINDDAFNADNVCDDNVFMMTLMNMMILLIAMTLMNMRISQIDARPPCFENDNDKNDRPGDDGTLRSVY